MQDIKKPSSRSRSDRDISSRVEQFERRTYRHDAESDEEDYAESAYTRKRSLDKMDIYPKKGSEDFTYRDSRTKYVGRNNTGVYVFSIVLVLLILFVGLYTYVFDSAVVTFIPKNQEVQVNKSFVFGADREDMLMLHYELATTSLTKSKTLAVSETKKIEARAFGKIIIYNNFDSNPQRLIKNTRFETPDGKIFRINESLTIPGKKGDVLGSVEATVYADSYGSEYNITPTDFTIPGFKGTPRYAGFFAKSNNAMSGGASGNTSLVSVADMNSAKDELALELDKTIKNALKETKRDGYLGLYDNVQVTFLDNEQDMRIGKTSTYQVTATGYLLLVDKSDLAKNIAMESYGDYVDEDVKLAYDENLHFSLKDSTNLVSDNKIEILVEGNPTIVWVSDEKTIGNLLLGKKKEDFANIMKGVPSIEKAEINFSPMWLNTFPSKASSISFIENIPKR